MKRLAIFLMILAAAAGLGSCSAVRHCKAPRSTSRRLSPGCCGRFARHRRHGVVAVLRRFDPVQHHPSYVGQQQGHACRRGACRADAPALPHRQGRPPAVGVGNGLRRSRNQRLCGRGAEPRPRIRRQGYRELGARPVGKPALGQAQGPVPNTSHRSRTGVRCR